VDLQPYRLDMARRAAGSETINIAETDPVEAIRAMTVAVAQTYASMLSGWKQNALLSTNYRT
jgi:threonine dehydrogenase-like Zn-dependent dehydrogenase